jgi:hypothetical protein
MPWPFPPGLLHFLKAPTIDYANMGVKEKSVRHNLKLDVIDMVGLSLENENKYGFSSPRLAISHKHPPLLPHITNQSTMLRPYKECVELFCIEAINLYIISTQTEARTKGEGAPGSLIEGDSSGNQPLPPRAPFPPHL